MMHRFGPAIVLLAWTTASADDWPAFRGPTGTGISAETRAPVKWGPEKNIKWKTALPAPGNGSPIVSNGRVFLNAAEDPKGRKRALFCFDRKDGRLLWKQTVTLDKEMPTHKTNPHGSSTPVANGKRVVTWQGSAGLFCYDFEGKEIWSRRLGEFKHMWGYGSSPVLHGGKIFLNCSPGRRTFVAAINLESGKTLWETEEPYKGTGDRNDAGKYMGSWCTPIIARVRGKDQVICTMPTRIVAYDPDKEKILWWCNGIRHPKGDLAYSSPVIVGRTLVAIGGFGGPGIGVRLGGSGDVTASHRLWRTEKNPQNIGSGVTANGHLYVPFAAAGRIDCIDPNTGERLWNERVGKAAYWGSMVQAAGRLYVTDQEGNTAVLRPNPERVELLALNPLNEKTNATPAISDGEIFIRTFNHLYCIASP